jgi:hypothetical protein
MLKLLFLSYLLLVVAGTLRAEANTGSPIRQTDSRGLGFIESFIAKFQISRLALLVGGQRSPDDPMLSEPVRPDLRSEDQSS